MTKYAILQIFEPKKDSQGNIPYDASQALGKISNACRSLSKNGENTCALGEYAWIFDLSTDMHMLSRLTFFAESGMLSYRVAFLDEKLPWMPYDKTEGN